MSTQIQYRAGHPYKFVATRSFSLGASGMSITHGSELEFDGTQVRYDGSNPVTMPQLRGAVKAGWLVLEENYNPNDMSASIPKAAGVQVRSAQGGNPMDPQTKTMVTTVDAEEREVGNVANHARQTQQRNANHRPGQRTASMSIEPQEGVHVRSLSTPARQSTNLEHESAAEAIRRANSAQIQPGTGRTREEMLAGMSEEERAEYLASVESKKLSHVDAPVIVGRVAPTRNQQKEGFNITNQVGGGIEIADPSGMDGPVEESVTSAEGMVFRNTNVGKPKAKVTSVANGSVSDMRRKIAKSICPDFPDNYVFEEPARKKIARLQADFDDRPDVIRAVAAAESDDEVKRRLVEEFPEAFA